MPKLNFSIAFFVGYSLLFSACNAQEDRITLDKQSSKFFEEKVFPLLEKYCIDCHSPDDSLNFLSAKNESDVFKLRDVYSCVLEQMDTNAMPPRDLDQPTNTERKLITDWIKKKLDLKLSDYDRIAQYVVEAFEDKHGNLWFGTMSKGVARYDGKTLTWFNEKSGLPSNAVPSIAEDKNGTLWLGTHGGICRFDGKKFVALGRLEGLPEGGSNSPMDWSGVQTDRKGNVWVGVGKKVYRYDGKSFNEFKIPLNHEKLESYSIVSGRLSFKLEDKNGNLWFGGDGAGAFKFDGKRFTQFTKVDGLCSNTVNSIMEDKQGRIWFACMQSYQPNMSGDGGLCRYDGEKFTKFNDVKGLSKNDIYTIFETKSGDIWISAPRVGVYRYDGKTFTLFNKSDKKTWTRNFGIQSILEDSNGTLWFGFSGGLFRFNGKSFYNITPKGPWGD